jgi:hypothetical protein
MVRIIAYLLHLFATLTREMALCRWQASLFNAEVQAHTQTTTPDDSVVGAP